MNINKALVFLLLISFPLYSQTIAEKKAGVMPAGSDLVRDLQKVLVEVNKELMEDHAELNKLYAQVHELFLKNAPTDEYKELLDRINRVRAEIDMLQNNWREMATQGGTQVGYALWHEPESTLGQLVIDYGSQNYVYLMSPEIATLPVSVDSNIPIPRSSWNEMMELILTQNGVGFKQLNPYLRQLYFIKQDRSAIQLITNKRQDLEFFPPQARLAFMLTPEPAEVRRIWAFLDKFVNPQSTVLQVVGRDILIIASAAEILDLLKLYDFVNANRGDKEYKIKTVTKVDAEEMAKILGAIFDQFGEGSKGGERTLGQGLQGQSNAPGSKGAMVNIQTKEKTDTGEANGLRIIALKHIAQAIFLVGTKKEIEKAEEIIDEVESQVGSAREKTVWWYTAKHSDPEELAQILEKIYSLMVASSGCKEDGCRADGSRPGAKDGESADVGYLPPEPPPPPPQMQQNPFYQQGNYVVNPTPVEPRPLKQQVANRGRNNFIVDLKTGMMVMVVEADLLPKIKELVKKLDVPKKMVQVEVLVVEKIISRQDDFGLNLLRLGDSASDKNFGGVNFHDIHGTGRHDHHRHHRGDHSGDHQEHRPDNTGIFEFILKQKWHDGFPAFDLIYKFLIRQQDMRINANPTIVTMNQTPAKLAIVDEITLNMGATYVNTNNGYTPQSSLTRSQYGITITVIPTIHMSTQNYAPSGNRDDDVDYITLDTDIVFDTVGAPTPHNFGNPNIIRRNVKNMVSIPDGQTVVIGGLRRKNTDDSSDSIPFIGEIPGFGKLFSNSVMTERAVETIIFLTPKIIRDPAEDFMRLRGEEMLKRAGDIPEFMCELYMAQEAEKNRCFAGTMNILLGRPLDRCVPENYYRDNATIYPYNDPKDCMMECNDG